MNTNFAELLKQKTDEFDKRERNLKEERRRELNDVLASATQAIRETLASALRIFEAVPEDNRSEVLADAGVKESLASFGVKKAKKKTRTTPASDKPYEQTETDKKILAVLEVKTGKAQKDIIKASGKSSVTVSKRLQIMEKQGLVALHQAGTANYWTKKG